MMKGPRLSFVICFDSDSSFFQHSLNVLGEDIELEIH
jgi:hypothetical protein